MTIVSSLTPVRFVPDDQADRPAAQQVAFLMRPPSILDKGRFDDSLLEKGARYAPDSSVVATLRAGLRRCLAEAPVQRDEYLALVDRFEVGEGVDADLMQDLADLELYVRSIYAPLELKIAARARWLRLAPIEAIRLFCEGWEGLEAPFVKAADGTVSLASLAAVRASAAGLVEAAGWHAVNMMMLTEDEEKNLSSPSRGRNGPTTSPAASTSRPTNLPKTAKGGASGQSESIG